MSYFPGINPNAYPGMLDAVLTTEIECTWGNPEKQMRIGGVIASTAADATNSPTTTLRKGLVLGQITSSGKYKQYSPSATDGSQFAVGILQESVVLYNVATGANADVMAHILIAGAVKVGSLIGFDEQARRQLGTRFIWDDLRATDVYPRDIVAKTADYTVVAGDIDKMFTTTGAAGAVIFTLPTTIVKGFRCRFINTVNQTMTVTAPSGLLVTFNNAAATSVSFATANNKIGASVEILTNEDGSKYVTLFNGANTVTVA